MAQTYPYTISNNKIPQLFEKIRTAAKPPKFTIDFLTKMGFPSSNDRALPSILKGLGFLQDDGTPTTYYDRLKDQTDQKYVLAERIKAQYNELFAINEEIYKSSEDEIKGAIARVTGQDANSVNRYFATFKALCQIAKFDPPPRVGTGGVKQSENKDEPKVSSTPESEKPRITPDFSYNIQIQLPATNDISVYNAIFKSLKDNLL